MDRAEPIVFYFDYLSSNAYLAWARLPALAAAYGRPLELEPVLFAGLLDAHGQLGPAEIPAKAWWTWRNNLRKAALLGIPLRPPAFHPFRPLLSLRVSCLPMEENRRRALVDGLFRAAWAESRDLGDPDVVADVARAGGLDGAALVAAANEPEAKARLRARTDAAIAAGVFGVPSMRVGRELFWGYDDLPYLELHLAGRDPIPPAPEAPPARPPASAVRRRVRARDGAR
ncbi:MAG TPA: 2-hydroxychromene-2-carboxylate isomerase [Myxococcota bacterium]